MVLEFDEFVMLDVFVDVLAAAFVHVCVIVLFALVPVVVEMFCERCMLPDAVGNILPAQGEEGPM